MSSEMLRPKIGVVGGEIGWRLGTLNDGEEVGKIIGRRGAILVFDLGTNYEDSQFPLATARGARSAGGDTLGITTTKFLARETSQKYATWVLTPSKESEDYQYQTLIRMSDALIVVNFNLTQQRDFARRVTGRIPMIRLNSPRMLEKGSSLIQAAADPKEAVDFAISKIMAKEGRRKPDFKEGALYDWAMDRIYPKE